MGGISCKKLYETLLLTDSCDADTTEDRGNTSSTDNKCCFHKDKRMRKRKKRTSRWKYPEPVTYHKHPNSDSNAIGINKNLFQQAGKSSEQIRTSYSNIVKQNQKMLLFLQIVC